MHFLGNLPKSESKICTKASLILTYKHEKPRFATFFMLSLQKGKQLFLILQKMDCLKMSACFQNPKYKYIVARLLCLKISKSTEFALYSK